LLPPDKINLKPLISRTKLIPKNVKQNSGNILWNLETKEQAVDLMAHVFAIWTLQNSGTFFEENDATNPKSYLLQPRDAQVVSIFRILGIGNDIDSYTGAVKKSNIRIFSMDWCNGKKRS